MGALFYIQNLKFREGNGALESSARTDLGKRMEFRFFRLTCEARARIFFPRGWPSDPHWTCDYRRISATKRLNDSYYIRMVVYLSTSPLPHQRINWWEYHVSARWSELLLFMIRALILWPQGVLFLWTDYVDSRRASECLDGYYYAWIGIIYARKSLQIGHFIIKNDLNTVISWIHDTIRIKLVHFFFRDITIVLHDCLVNIIRHVYEEVNSMID